MAYNTEDLEKQALKAIKEHKVPFIEHLVSYLPCDKTTFYAHNLHESNVIKEAIEKQKVDKKSIIMNKWLNGDNATAQIAAYKLLSNDSEFCKLSGQQIDHKNNGGSFNASEATTEELIKRANATQSVENEA
jgi:hypothetical protein